MTRSLKNGARFTGVQVVTNVAPVHLEFFDSLAGIARAKYELIEALPSSGTAVLNADDEYVSQFGRDFKGKVVTYGTRATADVRAEKVRTRGVEGSEFDVVVGGVVGEVDVVPVLAVVLAGWVTLVELLLDVEPLLPQPARSAPPASATTNQVVLCLIICPL